MRGNWSSVGVDNNVLPMNRSSMFSDSPTNTSTKAATPSPTHALGFVMPHSPPDAAGAALTGGTDDGVGEDVVGCGRHPGGRG
ncbi:hypothetical protein Lesp02_30220 [Lentzea sp. NBRC 105346]|nr:hypothetical protein Lesp02_30220 [Lentzea sp. NBRC 105346]